MASNGQFLVLGWMLSEADVEEAEPRVIAQCGGDNVLAESCMRGAVRSGSWLGVHIRWVEDTDGFGS